eukprot:1181341-Prorocentrum_minimum.AAC.1
MYHICNTRVTPVGFTCAKQARRAAECAAREDRQLADRQVGELALLEAAAAEAAAAVRVLSDYIQKYELFVSVELVTGLVTQARRRREP